jgi:hypothetical protein
MTTAAVLVVLLALLVVVALAVVRALQYDGYGRRPPPDSRRPDMFDPRRVA